MIRLVVVAVAAVCLSACFAGSNKTSGLGVPEVSVDFPATSSAGSSQVAKLHITDPGPGRMSSVVVAFSSTGPSPGATALPPPIVGVGAAGSNAAITDIRPKPVAVSQDGVIYRFGALPEGKSMTISFTLEVPSTPGVVANAVVVYDGAHPDRAHGVRLETVVSP